jgi:hypothetical protein
MPAEHLDGMVSLIARSKATEIHSGEGRPRFGSWRFYSAVGAKFHESGTWRIPSLVRVHLIRVSPAPCLQSACFRSARLRRKTQKSTSTRIDQ